MERRRRPVKTCRASGMPSQRQGDEVIGRGLITVMASSSANVEAPPTAGVQLTEGPLAAEVPAGVHPGALSSNARAGVGDTNGTDALCELPPVKLGIGGGPCWPPGIHACSPSIKVCTMAVIVAPSWSRTCSLTISRTRATCALIS